MKKRKFDHLKNPPAIESVLDITTDEITDDNIQLLHVKNGALRKKFPGEEQIHLYEHSVIMGKNQQMTHTSRPLGYRYKSEDQKEIAQFRPNGFSYNRLQPYPGWKTFIKTGIETWDFYKKIRKTFDIKRIGLRFINVIKLPDENIDLSKLFKVSITSQLKSGLGHIKQFQYRYVREFEEIDCIAIVNFVQNATNQGQLSFVLDIDVIKQAQAKGLDETIISTYLENMRQAKNAIFFDTLTPKVLENYKK